MIGIRTPFRISFLGGGTDLPEFYRMSQGNVISTSVDKYMYLFVNKFFDDRVQIKYSITELVERIDDIQHPIVRELLKITNTKGVDINSIADIPSGTGLGSSSSFSVGLINALSEFDGISLNNDQLAEKASDLEINILKEPIGKQDQYAAAFGGLNFIKFNKDDSVDVSPIDISADSKSQLEKDMLVFYTEKTRKTSTILTTQRENILDYGDTFKRLEEMSTLCVEGKSLLESGDIVSFEKLLHDSWTLKRTVASGISNNDIDEIYDIGMKNGARGGKLLGAGGGGFILFFCDREAKQKIRKKLSHLREINFKFEQTGSIRVL